MLCIYRQGAYIRIQQGGHGGSESAAAAISYSASTRHQGMFILRCMYILCIQYSCVYRVMHIILRIYHTSANIKM